MRYLGILALALALSSPAAARKRPRPHAAHQKAAPVVEEAPPPAHVAAPEPAPRAMPASAIAQENDDEVPGKHKK